LTVREMALEVTFLIALKERSEDSDVNLVPFAFPVLQGAYLDMHAPEK
jgi:hypothetical protein